MTVNLDDYRDCLQKAGPHVRDTLRESFAEAARVMSPAGLRSYLDGAKSLCGLGRGGDLVVSYLQGMPAVAKEVGEEVVKDCTTAAMKLASMVSGEIIALLFDGLPAVSRQLGDAELLRGYVNLVHQLSAKAPRGLRPMLLAVDELFSKLTLGGLRRWALWGAQAHARDFTAQSAYFGLESPDSRAVLQRERRGTLFIDNQRRLNFYLRALWGRDFFLRPTSGDFETREGYRPYIEHRVIHLPDAVDDYDGLPGKDLYRAAAAHAAAHLVYTPKPLSAEALTPVQMMFVGLFEDARVERLAIREFPGLKQVWRQFHTRARDISYPTDPVVGLLERAARALLDDDYRDSARWVREAAEAFRETFADRSEDPQASWDLGVTFFNKLGERAAIPSLRVLESMGIPYRDDNRYVWAFDDAAWRQAEYLPASRGQRRRTVNVMEMVNEVDNELAGDDAQEVWTLETELFRDGDPEGVSINRLEGTEPVSEPCHYHEWDYQVQLYRPDWVTVLEKRQSRGNPQEMDRILDEYRPLAGRIRRIIDALQPEGVTRLRRQQDGDDIDLNAAIRAMIDMRMRKTPDSRINLRYVRRARDLAVLVLLDLSESTNEKLGDSDKSVIDLARDATALLSWAIDGVGDPFAIHAFASDGRHDVQYYRLKDFGQSYDDKVKARLAGMRGGLSTRMGAALRHAATFLAGQLQTKKLVLLVSDGEPADVDVRDPQYLRHDTRKAVEELAARGVVTYCLTLDPHADEYVSRLFGPRGYMVVDHIQRLPERLPMLYAGLTS